jgi:hypothetical protein
VGLFWIGISYFIHESPASQASLCPVKNVTGMPCPACGTTRSIIAILYGEFNHAALINPLGFLMAGVMILFPAWILRDVATGSFSFYRFYQQVELKFHNKWIAGISVLLICLNWAWNFIKEV